MKKLFFLLATLAVVACGKDDPQQHEPRDPNDITGWYSATYRMTINGLNVSFADIPSRTRIYPETGEGYRIYHIEVVGTPTWMAE